MLAKRGGRGEETIDLWVGDRAPGWFVGRASELAAAERLLDDPSGGVRVLLVDGPGGVGKSAFLMELARRARKRDWAVRRVETNGVAPMGTGAPTDTEADGGAPLVVLVDDWDGTAALERFLGGPTAHPTAARVVVFASRRAAPLGETGWATRGVRIERISLAPLGGDEAKALLTTRGLGESAAVELATRLGGHPLVLALAAELQLLRGELPQSLDEAPELVVALLRRLIDATVDPTQRQALEALATVRSLTESLLAAMLGRNDVAELFAWLADRSFVTIQPSGLVAHDLAREALAADLAWRSPEQADLYKKRAMALIVRRLRKGTVAEQTRAMADLFFLFRSHPVMKVFAEWAGIYRLVADHATRAEHALAVEAIRRHEGPTSARLAAMWLERFPGGAYAVRRTGGPCVGFSLFLRLDRLGKEDRGQDPLVDAALARLAAVGVDRRQPSVLHRFWLGFDSYQAANDIYGMNLGLAAQQTVETNGIAYAMGVFADAHAFAPVFGIFGYDILDKVQVDGRGYSLVARDWRDESPLGWFAGYAERLTGLDADAERVTTVDDSSPGGADDWFAETRDALRGLHEPHRVAASALAARLVGKTGPVVERAARLRARIEEAVAALSGSRKGERAMAALSATYLDVKGTQEEVAEALDLPFSTYRRHLNEGIALLAEFLRQAT